MSVRSTEAKGFLEMYIPDITGLTFTKIKQDDWKASP